MDRVNDLVGTSFSAVFQLRRLASGGGAKPETLYKHMKGFVDDLMKRASAAGFNQADVQDMAYAVVALIDEVALGLTDAIREYWMAKVLQFHYFKENQAGDGFFDRLKEVRSDPNRHEVLQVYYLALVFGFKGKFAVRGGDLELMELQEDVARDLSRHLPRGFDEDVLSEAAERPPEATVAAKQSRLLLALSAGAVAISIVLFIGLKLALSSAVSDVTKLTSPAATKKAEKAEKAAKAAKAAKEAKDDSAPSEDSE